MIYLFRLFCSVMLAGVTICLDPGHGGTSTGAVGEYILEKDVVLEMAFHVQNWLVQVPGVTFVALTRDGDYNVSLQSRSSYANSWGFDYFVSIHENAFNGSVQGTETFCGSLDPIDQSYQLASLVQSRILDAYGYTDRGVKLGDYLHVIRETNMPAILGEGSFLDYDASWNESYLYAFNVDDHTGVQAWGYADAICSFLGFPTPPYGNGVVIMDNLSPGFSVDDSLAWEISTSGAPWMMNCRTADSGSDRIAQWVSCVPVTGLLSVESWWTSGSNRSSSVCYRVFHSGGFSDVSVNQLSGGGEWVSLGNYYFDGNCTVEILGEESEPGVVVADAVKLSPPLGLSEGDFSFAGLSVTRNPASSFTFILPSSGESEILVYNSMGRLVSALIGAGSVEWTPVDLPCGVYFAVETGQMQSVKLVYID